MSHLVALDNHLRLQNIIVPDKSTSKVYGRNENVYKWRWSYVESCF